MPKEKDVNVDENAFPPSNEEDLVVVRGACPHDCPDTCATLVTVTRGRVVRMAGDGAHPFTQGFLCTKVNRYPERTHHADRLTTPLKRVGPKGSGEFAPISWEVALREIAERLQAIAVGPHGAQAILPYSYAGTMGKLQGGAMDHRFFHLLGASKLDRTICATAGMVGMQMTVGQSVGADGESAGDAADLILLWGTNTLTANPHLWPHLLRARERGVPIRCIDPIRTRTAAQADEWIPIRPGTDAALALAIMHVLFADGLEDRDYLAAYTIGEAELRARVTEWTPARASVITGIPADRIIALAREYGTARAAFVRINYGLQRHAGGGMAVRTIACLPAVTGHWRRPGGGVQLSTSGNFKFNMEALERPDLSPPVRTINMTRLGDALTLADAGVGGPPVQALIVYNSNPAAIAPDTNAVRRGLAREDLLTVVLEHFQTDTADFADYLLPATTQLEHWDVHSAYGHVYATLNRPAIAPIGDALPNTEIFRRLGAAMGMSHPALQDDDLTLIRQALNSPHERMQGVTFERLMADGWVRLNVPRPYAPYAQGGFATPSGKVEFASPRMAALGLDAVPTYTPPREIPDEAPELAARFPLQLISSPRHQFLNTTFVNVPSLSRNAEPELHLHPTDAAIRDLADGASVRIHNDRGAFHATLRVTDGVREGVAWAPSIWWQKLSQDGENANAVTSQALTDLGAGAAFYDCLVEVEAA
ncbi:MAG: molybdopterin oxidoreductase family protein [Gemmatimonadaceae bacterium]|nr:molybdopterin oxidoreductase family protein [Gemmatimonadaceae bacterium]